ncbi:hypothetical protein BLNAU_15322 [Blattamonas nauphoetae]|uniref:MIT domain-containing protein n=1 Tax=Blattamonas nauphoetae TaxID=2049346 RepID=A0ABQ9XB47_9EUKA|nr:hypothetical protein BLNAU_15322 [Blattamonas nauphoetae]
MNNPQNFVNAANRFLKQANDAEQAGNVQTQIACIVKAIENLDKARQLTMLHEYKLELTGQIEGLLSKAENLKKLKVSSPAAGDEAFATGMWRCETARAELKMCTFEDARIHFQQAVEQFKIAEMTGSTQAIRQQATEWIKYINKKLQQLDLDDFGRDQLSPPLPIQVPPRPQVSPSRTPSPPKFTPQPAPIAPVLVANDHAITPSAPPSSGPIEPEIIDEKHTLIVSRKTRNHTTEAGKLTQKAMECERTYQFDAARTFYRSAIVELEQAIDEETRPEQVMNYRDIIKAREADLRRIENRH